MAPFIHRTGDRFGRLVVLRRVENDIHRKAQWECLCDCGNTRVVVSGHLNSGNTTSCGCARTKHGHTLGKQSSEYQSWHQMKSRCLNPNNRDSARYGPLGICKEWVESFEQFYKDMGPKPTPRHSIERRDNELGYCKENCLWATPAEQQRNTRQTRFLSFGGKHLCVADWAKEIGINPVTLHYRLRKGWPIERALSEPTKRRI